jgi:tRNA A37 threonylcarbamoyladenosine modification protein TsaB
LINLPEEVLEDIAVATVFCGEGVQERLELIKERLGPKGVVMPQPSAATRLWSLAVLAQQRLDAEDTDNLADLQPYYLRMPSIGGPKRRDWAPQGS